MTAEQWPEAPMQREDCADWIASEMLRDRWFRRHWPQVRAVQVDAGKAHAYGSYDWVVETGHLVLPEWAGRMTVAHEMAHVCSEAEFGWLTVAAHGPEWSRHYLTLTNRYIGLAVGKTLEANMVQCGVRL